MNWHGETVEPHSQAVLDMVAATGRLPMHEAGVEAAREAMRASRELLGGPVPDTVVRDLAAPAPEGLIPIRLYRSRAIPIDQPLPLLVYFHGGGFVLGDIRTGDAFCAGLANRIGIAVAAVNYRLAPEHRFPAAVEDSYSALKWLAANASTLSLCGDKLAVAGESAGGNLAAVCALKARDHDGPALRAQILLYPVTDFLMTSASYRRNATGYLLTADTMLWFRHLYLGNHEASDWRASPLRAADLSGVAPALVVTCGFDPLRDEGVAYATRLVGAGVQTVHLDYPRQIHGFAMWGKASPDAARVLGQVADELQRSFY